LNVRIANNPFWRDEKLIAISIKNITLALHQVATGSSQVDDYQGCIEQGAVPCAAFDPHSMPILIIRFLSVGLRMLRVIVVEVEGVIGVDPIFVGRSQSRKSTSGQLLAHFDMQATTCHQVFFTWELSWLKTPVRYIRRHSRFDFNSLMCES
jgi:hypothetical protein